MCIRDRYCNQGTDECIQYDYRRPGFVEGNPILFSYYDSSDNLYYELSPHYGSGNGTFGIPFDDTLTFKYFDSENLRDAMNSLFNRDVKGKLYRLIYELNKDNEIQIKTGVGITRSITTG